MHVDNDREHSMCPVNIKKVPLGLEFNQLVHIEIFINSAKLIILVKIYSNVLRLYILQCALLSTTDRSFRNRQQRNERKYITIFQQEVSCLITIKWSYSNLTFHYTEV